MRIKAAYDCTADCIHLGSLIFEEIESDQSEMNCSTLFRRLKTNILTELGFITSRETITGKFTRRGGGVDAACGMILT